MITKFFHRRDWCTAALAVVLIVCMIYFDIRIPQYMNEITDSFLINNTDVVIAKGTEMIICAFLSLGLALCVGFILSNTSASVGRNIRIDQFDKVQSFAMEDINRFSAASLVTRSTNDVYQIQNFIARGMIVGIKSPIMAVWAIAMIYSAHQLQWTASVIIGLVLSVTVMGTALFLSTPLFKKIQWFTDGVNRSTRESLDGIRVIRAYNAEQFQEERFEEPNQQLLRNNLRTNIYMAPAFPIIQSMMNFITLSIYWTGAGIIMGTADPDESLALFSDMIVFTTYAAMAMSSIMQFMGIFRMVPRARVGLKRVEEVVNTESSIKGGNVTEGKEGHKGEIEFREVSFVYPGTERKVLDNISFKVEKGKTFAVIGSTGTGKTTLVNLIPRFYDATEGEILVDGVDVREYTINALHEKIGYVPQNAIIFSGSVYDNVNYGHGSDKRSDEDVRRALRIAQAETFVDAMPDGWDSHISQHGRNISGGQKQRVSIARALCKNPEIYLLDDTFSALDYKTDHELRAALRSEMEGSTVFIVAQRIGTIMDADEIIVLDEGRIVGRGTHRELLSNCPVYQDIARSQLTEEELQ